jgi:hypothetical protein
VLEESMIETIRCRFGFGVRLMYEPNRAKVKDKMASHTMDKTL